MSSMYWVSERGRAEAAPGEDVLHLDVIEDEAVLAGYLERFPAEAERGRWVTREELFELIEDAVPVEWVVPWQHASEFVESLRRR